MVEISSAIAILGPLRASLTAFWSALGVEVPSSLTEGLSSFAEVPSSSVKVPSMIVDANCMLSYINCMVSDVNCTVGDVIAMIALKVGKVVVVDWSYM